MENTSITRHSQGTYTSDALLMTTPPLRIGSTALGIAAFIAIFAFKACNGINSNTKSNMEETQYYQLNTLNSALNCINIHNELGNFVIQANVALMKKDSVQIPDAFDTGKCGQPAEEKGKIPKLEEATKHYLHDFQEVTQTIDTNNDHILSAKEFDTLRDNYQALTGKIKALRDIYLPIKAEWYRTRIDIIGSDHSRQHIYWVYTLAQDINPLTRELQKENFDIPEAEKTLATLKSHLNEMNSAMQVSNSWDQKDIISKWEKDISDFMKAAEQRIDFVKNKASSASEEDIEDSIYAFQEAQILDQPTHFKDTFLIPARDQLSLIKSYIN